MAIVSGNMANYTVTQTSCGVFRGVGADGLDTLTNVEFQHSEQQVIDFLNANGFGDETYGDWFTSGNS